MRVRGVCFDMSENRSTEKKGEEEMEGGVVETWTLKKEANHSIISVLEEQPRYLKIRDKSENESERVKKKKSKTEGSKRENETQKKG